MKLEKHWSIGCLYCFWQSISNLLFKICFYFIYVYICVSVLPLSCRILQRLEEDIGSSEVEITSGCELPSVGQSHNHTKQSLRFPNLIALRKQHILIFHGQVHIHAMLTYLISCLFHHHKYDTWLKTWSHDICHAFMLPCLLVIILLQPPYKLNIYSCNKYLLSSDLLCAWNVRSWSFKDKLGSSHVFKLRPFFTVGKKISFCLKVILHYQSQ